VYPTMDDPTPRPGGGVFRRSGHFGRLLPQGLCFLFLAGLTGGKVQAQELPAELTLDDALRVAERSNPAYRMALNDMGPADWAVRSAYGQWIPNTSFSTGMQYQGSGEQQFGGLTTEQLGFGGQPSYLLSNYNLNAGLQINGSTLLTPGQAKARRDATAATIRNTLAQLRFFVTQTYLGVLREDEGVRLAQQELERAQLNLRLAQGQLEIGTATRVDVTQAEVAVGRAQVGVLQAQNAVRTARLRLGQQLGVEPGADFELVTAFELAQPGWTEADLRALALEQNPALLALRANESSADYGVKIARSAYLPSLSINASTSGFSRQASSTDFLVNQARSRVEGQMAQCSAQNELFRRLADPLPPADCSGFVLTPTAEQAIISGNNVFPFNFTGSPPSLSVSINVPIFQGLTRQNRLEDARVQRDDVRHQVRQQELQMTADLAAGLGNVRTAYQTALIEQRNQSAADEQLRLAQEQYRLGSVSFLQLVEAETVKAQADRSLVDAIFTYHENVASLEATVGTSLRDR